MRNFFLTSSLVFVALTQPSISYSDTLRSATLKRQICAALPSLRLPIEISPARCASGQFEIESVLKDTMAGAETNTLMKIVVNVDQTVFKAILKKQVFINDLGKLTVKPGWGVSLQAGPSSPQVAVIEAALIGHSNVVAVAPSREQLLPLPVREWHHNCERVDFNCTGFEYYEIYGLPGQSEVIGYLIVERSSSDERGEDYVVEAKFDAHGNQVGEISEGSIGH